MRSYSPTKTFFCADLHLLETNIISKARRPFADPGEMTAELVRRWNETVPADGIVFYLGDVTMKPPRLGEEIIAGLNGEEKHLAWGNHDANRMRKSSVWTSSEFGYEFRLDGHLITLNHYRLTSWNGKRRGHPHFHGHWHGRYPDSNQCVDVGVDNPAWAYAPVRFDRLLAHMAAMPPHPEHPNPPDDATDDEAG